MNILSLFSQVSILQNLDKDFYLSLGLCFAVILIMNIVLWNLKPQKDN